LYKNVNNPNVHEHIITDHNQATVKQLLFNCVKM